MAGWTTRALRTLTAIVLAMRGVAADRAGNGRQPPASRVTGIRPRCRKSRCCHGSRRRLPRMTGSCQRYLRGRSSARPGRRLGSATVAFRSRLTRAGATPVLASAGPAGQRPRGRSGAGARAGRRASSAWTESCSRSRQPAWPAGSRTWRWTTRSSPTAAGGDFADRLHLVELPALRADDSRPGAVPTADVRWTRDCRRGGSWSPARCGLARPACRPRAGPGARLVAPSRRAVGGAGGGGRRVRQQR